jgi:hypothetical protein
MQLIELVDIDLERRWHRFKRRIQLRLGGSLTLQIHFGNLRGVVVFER